jgi:hypothetical protein
MIKVTSVVIRNEFHAAVTDWLLANVGDKITIETSFTVENTILASIDNPIKANAQDGYLGVNWLVDPLARFADFKVGDSVDLWNYKTNTAFLGNPYSILEKLSDSEIRVANVGTLSGIPADSDLDYLSVTLNKPITAVKYKYNFIENADQPTFDSKVDQTEQLLTATGLDASDVVTVVPMNFIGQKSYQIGNATIQGNGLTLGSSNQYKFKIIHNTFVTPFILATQLNNILSNTKPDYFLNQNCLKAILDIEAAFLYTDPNFLQTEQVTEVVGNTGWFNENFNTGLSNYKVDSVKYLRPDTTQISAIELTTAETTVEVVIKNTVDSPFSNNNTKFVLNFCRIPYDESEVINNIYNQQQNFLFDRRLQTVGSAAVNGDYFGTLYQSLKDIQATFISTSEIKITCKIAMVTNVTQVIGVMNERRYMLWVSLQNHTLSTTVSDKVSLLVDAKEFFEDATDVGMIVADTKALRHFEDDRDTEGVALDGFVGGLDASANFADPSPPPMINSPFALVDNTNGVTIGITTNEVDINTALNKLVVSINTNTPQSYLWFASGFGALPTFDNSAGYTASWDGTTFKVFAPVGSGTGYNGVDLKLVARYAFYVQTQYMSGGVATISSDLTVFPEDEVVFNSRFYIDKNGRAGDDIKLKSITGIIKAKNAVTLEEFELDKITTDVSSSPVISGNQFIDILQDRIYHIPSTEIRKKLKIKRRIDLDAADKYYYEFALAELIRWEYWKELAIANGAFFDTGEPNNGWNEFWHRYTTVSDWDLYYELDIRSTKNGKNLTHRFENKILSTDYDTNADWNPNTIKSYKDSDNTLLTSGGDKFILGYETTRIEAEFTKVSGTPVLADVTVVIGIEVFEEGGIEGRRRLSSKWIKDTDTWLDSTTGNGKVNLSLSGNTVKAVCLVDNSQIPLEKGRLKITARLYEITPDFPSKYFQDGNDFIYQDGDTYIFQDQ